MKSNKYAAASSSLKRKGDAALVSLPPKTNKPKTAVIPASVATVPPVDSGLNSNPSDVDVKKPAGRYLKVIQPGAKTAPVPACSGSGSDSDSDFKSDSNSSDMNEKQPVAPLPVKRAPVPGQMVVEVFTCAWVDISVMSSVVRRENSDPAVYQVSSHGGLMRVSDVPMPLHYRQYFDSERLRSKNVKQGELLEIADGELQFVRKDIQQPPVRVRADCSDFKAAFEVNATFSKFAEITMPGLSAASGLLDEGRLGYKYRLVAVLVRASSNLDENPLSDPEVCFGVLLERRDKDGHQLLGTANNNVMLFYKNPKLVMVGIANAVKRRLGLASAPTLTTTLAWFDIFDEHVR